MDGKRVEDCQGNGRRAKVLFKMEMAKEVYDQDPETSVAIKRSLERGDFNLGMSCLTVDDLEGG